jgi:hypothetical protein
MSETMKALENEKLLAAWYTAQQMVRESENSTSIWERNQKYVRVERAAELGMRCLKAGLLKQM